MYFKKLILLTIIFLLASNAYALKDCPSDQSQRFHNCFGAYTDANGNQYVGEWRDDKQNGQGTFTNDDGDKYVGEFQDGKQHGQGTSTSANGEKYAGEFQDGKRHGQGTFTVPDGRQYVGEWKNDKLHGQGTYTWANEGKYIGAWQNGLQNGQGICESSQGSYACKWINGELQPYNETIQTAQIKKTKNSTGSKVFAKVGGFLAEAFIEGISKGIQVAIINEFNEPCTPSVRVKNTALPMGTGSNRMVLRKTRVKVKTCPAKYYFLN